MWSRVENRPQDPIEPAAHVPGKVRRHFKVRDCVGAGEYLQSRLSKQPSSTVLSLQQLSSSNRLLSATDVIAARFTVVAIVPWRNCGVASSGRPVVDTRRANADGSCTPLDRSRRFRARGRRGVTWIEGPTLGTPGDQQPEPARAAVAEERKAAIINAAGRLTACHRCGHPVRDQVRMGPIHRPQRRVITLHGGPQARKRRQITTDSERR